MAGITIRNLDEGIEQRLRLKATTNWDSMEQEARDILQSALDHGTILKKNVGAALYALFKPFGGVELETPPREQMREPPRLGRF